MEWSGLLPASLRDKLRTNLWLTPVGYSLASGGLAVGLLELDRRRESDMTAWFLYGGHAEGARAVLTTIASSMLTISGLVFSITILVLQLASSQFSPRVLGHFLEDRVTQSAMGMFLGSFVYAMVVLPQVRSETPSTAAFVPALSVFVAFVLVLASVALLVVYLHHMAHSIRAVTVINRIGADTREAIERLYPGEQLPEAEAAHELPAREPDLILSNERRAGVVISVNERALLEAAAASKLVMAVVPRVGEFVPHGAPVCRVWGVANEELLAPLAWMDLAQERTLHQDALFGFRQLVDIAERALSPGINDPSTACQALDHLHDLLRSLAKRDIPSPFRADEQQRLRLVLPRPSWDDYVQLSCEEIRAYGAGSVQVVRRLRSAIDDLLTVVGPERAKPLHVQRAQLEKAAADLGTM